MSVGIAAGFLPCHFAKTMRAKLRRGGFIRLHARGVAECLAD
jgi:hypothetical protein